MKEAEKRICYALIRKVIDMPIEGDSEIEINKEDIGEIFDFFSRYDLTHILDLGAYSQSETVKAVQRKAEQAKLRAVYRYSVQSCDLSEMCELFEAEKIQFMPLKGSVIRELYPEPWMRTSCDIDVLVKEGDVNRATALLEKRLGYKYKNKNGHDVSFYSPSETHIELHYNLIEKKRISDSVDQILSDVWQYAVVCEGWKYKYELTNEMFYAYHIAHMAKHFVNGGCGVRPFIDLQLIRNKYVLDNEKLKDLIERGGLSKFEGAMLRICDVWFEGTTHSEQTAVLEEYIFSAGLYGNLNNNVAIQQSKNGGKFKYALSKIWLPYDIIIMYYPFLKKYKILYPIMQLQRWFKLIFKGGLVRSATVLKINGKISRKEAESTKEMLNELGLM